MRVLAKVAVLAVLAGGPALAEDIALVIGNRNYSDLDRVTGADRVVDAAAALRARDIAVISGKNVTLDDMRALVGQFEQMAPNADALLVVLAGRFVQGGNDTFFLPTDSDVPGLTGLPGQSLPLSSVLQILSLAPGEAFLALAEDGAGAQRGPFLRDGIGDLTIPQGVTVLRAAPAPMAGLLSDVLAVDDAPVQGQDGVALSGYLPAGHGFLRSDEAGDSAALATAVAETQRERARADAAERRTQLAEQTARAARDGLDRAEAALWAATQEQDTASSYQRYVAVFPDGPHAAEARRLSGEISAEPFRQARLAEEALSLSRDQRRAIQGNLTALGFNTRGVDGIFGAGTRTAIGNWQVSVGRTKTGYLDAAEVRALAQQAADVEAARRAEEEARTAAILRADNAFWLQQGSGRTEDGMRAYLSQYPKGQWASVARDRLAVIDQQRRAEEEARLEEERRREDDAWWDRTGAKGSEQGLRAYLERYPTGRWSDTARAALANFAPSLDQNDERAWQRAQSAGTVDAYRGYLDAFPRGAFSAKAKTRINRLTAENDGAAAAAEQALGLNRPMRQAVEDRLAGLGLDPGQVDGEFDNATRRALRQYQQSAGLPVTGFVSQELVVKLLTDSVLDLLRR